MELLWTLDLHHENEDTIYFIDLWVISENKWDIIWESFALFWYLVNTQLIVEKLPTNFFFKMWLNSVLSSAPQYVF